MLILKKIIIFYFCFMAFFIGGCGNETIITPSELRRMCNVDPMQHCAYLGTSDGYHHFKYLNGKSFEYYKVAEPALILKTVFPLSAGQPYLVTEEMIDTGIILDKQE